MARRNLTALALLASLAGAAHAGTEITVTADQARMVSIPGQPGTVVVGNPNIADVTIQGSTAFIHGRNYGTTNVIFLDLDGNQIAALDVMVANGSINEVNVFKAGSKFSYSCAGKCEADLQVGDNIDYFKGLSDEITAKGGLANASQKSSE